MSEKEQIETKKYEGTAQVNMSQKDIAEKWQQIQMKAFTKWVNSHLVKRGNKIDSLLEDLRNGVALCQLLEVISEEKVGKINTNPKSRIHNIENLNLAINFISEHNVKLASIGAGALADGNVPQTLGTIWTIILRFAIKGLSEEGLSAKQGLLLWCRRKTEPYDNVDIKDFSGSFYDGLALCALIHRHRPDLIDYDTLTAENREKNFKLAFDQAYDHLGVEKLLDVEDIMSVPKIDERSMMTYVAQLYNVFSGMEKVETAGRRVGKFLEFQKTTNEWKHDYETRAKALIGAVQAKTAELASKEALPSDYAGTKGLITSFNDYKKTQRRRWITEENNLSALFGNIQAKLKAMNQSPYVPPKELSTDSIAADMSSLRDAEKQRRSALNSHLRQILDGLRKAFADPANAFYERLGEYKEFLATGASLSGSTKSQLEQTQGKFKELLGLESNLDPIEKAEKACEAANIEENEFTDLTYDDLSFEFEQLINGFKNRIQFLEGQVAEEESKGKVSADKLKEFKESFQHFDKDQDNKLVRLEFKSCLSGLGMVTLDFEGGDKVFESIFQRVSGGADAVDFDQYVNYMVSVTADNVTNEQLKESLDTIAQGKDHVTKQDLLTARLDQGQVEYLLSVLPKKEGIDGGYDYNAWLSTLGK